MGPACAIRLRLPSPAIRRRPLLGRNRRERPAARLPVFVRERSTHTDQLGHGDGFAGRLFQRSHVAAERQEHDERPERRERGPEEPEDAHLRPRSREGPIRRGQVAPNQLDDPRHDGR